MKQNIDIEQKQVGQSLSMTNIKNYKVKIEMKNTNQVYKKVKIDSKKAMHISKSQLYSLSPDEYLDRLQKPHSCISHKGKQQNYEQQIQLLQNILITYNQNTQSLQIKEKTIKDLEAIVEVWMTNILNQWKGIGLTQKDASKNEQKDKDKDIDYEQLLQLGYGLKIFGSFSLRTNSIDGDIDMICIVPDFVSREKHFYAILTDQLRKCSSVKEVFCVPDAIVPLIKMNINDVQIDLLISRLPIKFLKENPTFFDSVDCNYYHIVNEKQLRSVNGYRTSLYLKKNIKNYKNYQVVLKTIKMWAKNKGIYSQIYGYLGGAALSIMLAKIFQLYPNYSPLQLLDRFFFIYANWIWTMPVMIQDCSNDQKIQPGGMLIYTPLQPNLNAAHYVSRITCHITRKYLRLASKFIQDINRKKKQWKDLFSPIEFFSTYQNYIELSVMGEKHDQFIVWKGNIQSKIRKFIKYLQNQIQNLQLIEIHPYPTHFISKHTQYKYCYKYYFGLKCESNPNLSDYCEIDITPSVRNFLELLESYPGIDKVPKQLNIGFAYLEKNDIEIEIMRGQKHYNPTEK